MKWVFPNIRDYLCYLIQLQRSDAIVWGVDIFLLACGIIAYCTGVVAPLVIATTVFVLERLWSLGKLTRAALKFFGQRNVEPRRKSELHCKPVLLSEILPSRREELQSFQSVSAGENRPVVRSRGFDKVLWRKDMPLKVAPLKEKRVKAAIRFHKKFAVALITHQFFASLGKKQFTNDRKLCLSADLDINSDDGICRCHTGRYYDSFVSNNGGALALIDEDTRMDIGNDCQLFPISIADDGHPRLRTITESTANNHIGASTIAITRDGQLAVWEQTRAAESVGLLAPTGSGSCDAADERPTLHETLQTAMGREFREESSRNGADFSPSDIVITRVLGFFRWVQRGGKPEFVGITKLNVDAIRLDPNPSEVGHSSNKRPSFWPAADTSQLLESIGRILKLPELSVPLIVNLWALKEFAEQEPRECQTILRATSSPIS